jgi:hypothetical protein
MVSLAYLPQLFRQVEGLFMPAVRALKLPVSLLACLQGF